MLPVPDISNIQGHIKHSLNLSHDTPSQISDPIKIVQLPISNYKVKDLPRARSEPRIDPTISHRVHTIFISNDQ
jgi:hypothetical protein